MLPYFHNLVGHINAKKLGRNDFKQEIPGADYPQILFRLFGDNQKAGLLIVLQLPGSEREGPLARITVTFPIEEEESTRPARRRAGDARCARCLHHIAEG